MLRSFANRRERERSLSHQRLDQILAGDKQNLRRLTNISEGKLAAIAIKAHRPAATQFQIAFLHDTFMRLAHALDAVLRLAAIVGKLPDDFVIATGRR